MNKYIKNCMAFMVIGMCTMCSSAFAYTEIPDAGQSLGTAQIVPDGTTVIQGSIASLSSDADMYLFGWAGGDIIVDTVGSVSFDTQLFLFNIDGTGILANDDIMFSSTSRIPTTLSAGNYYLGLSRFDLDPYDSNNQLIFPTSPFTGVFGPLSSNPLDHWFAISFLSSATAYTINFNQPTTATVAVPEPGTLVLLGSLLVGVMCRKSRKIEIEKMDS